ncbi:MAG: ATP-binding protein [Gemmatimonadales bacterium]
MNTPPQETNREKLIPGLRRGFWLGAAGLACIGLTVIGLHALDRRLLGSIFESRELIRMARQSRVLAVDRETAVRGFLLSGNLVSLAPEFSARQALRPTLDSLVLLSGRSASRRDRALSVRRALIRWERGYVFPALADATAARTESARDLAGKELFDSVRGAIASFVGYEEHLYSRRVAFESLVQRVSLGAILLMITLVIAFLARFNLRAVRHAQQVIEQQEQLEDQAIELEHQAATLEEQAITLEEQNEEARSAAESVASTNIELTRAIGELQKARTASTEADGERKVLEEQLHEAKKMEAVGRLAGGVAHDFNNMLTAIKSYSELLLAEMDTANPQRSDVAEINKAADRAAVLTRQLLAFSRQQILRPEVMNLNAVVGEMQNMLRRLAGPGIQVVTRLQPDECIVKADPAEIERVIVNLVLNARDAMPKGGTVTIETSSADLDEDYTSHHAGMTAGSYVMLAVSDTGPGMPKEVRDKLFEPFFTTKERGKGTGLGLSSIYGIVKQSEGHIWVYSEPGHGTTFKVYLPCIDAPACAVSEIPESTAPRGGETILLVEDDDVVRGVAGRILRREGYTVVEAENGKVALALYSAAGFVTDLIVTDIVMPVMGGSELAHRIREVRPEARILFTSGYTEDRGTRQNLLFPGTTFLEKPFTPDALAQKTRELLDAVPANGATH